MPKTFAVVALLAIAIPTGLVEAKDMDTGVAPCTLGNPVGAICNCGMADNGRPVLCYAGQWCHPGRACTNQWYADPRELHSCTEKTCSLQHRKKL